MTDSSGGVARHTYDLVWVEGRDAVKFLDGILSQDLEAMTPGGVGRTFLLQPQGKLRHLMWALREDERVGLLVDAGRGGMLAEDLGYYRIRVKAELRVDPRPVDVIWGGSDGGKPGWSEHDGELTGHLVGRGIPRVFTTSAPGDARILSDGEARRWRVLAGEPVMDVDVDESTIPQETGLVEEAVSFTKGCYLGQELVARIDTRGRVNRRMCGLRFSSEVRPSDGTELSSDDRVVGALTSATAAPIALESIALAMVRREIELGESVIVAGLDEAAVVEALPFVRR